MTDHWKHILGPGETEGRWKQRAENRQRRDESMPGTCEDDSSEDELETLESKAKAAQAEISHQG